MLIGGLERLSLLDFPDCLSAIVFTQGCNFRCHFCYNPMLVWPSSDGQKGIKNRTGQPLIKEVDLFAFLKIRIGKLDGVVISGGEPTLHKDLPEFIKKIKDLGFMVKLDTNGTNPEMLERLVNDKAVDYIAMDIKAPWDKYKEIVGVDIESTKLINSVKILAEGTVPYEMRSTIAPAWHDEESIKIMAEQIPVDALWYLQKFLGERELVDENFINSRSFTDAEMEKMLTVAKGLRGNVRLR